jgi:SAM-dependent methyltransferase
VLQDYGRIYAELYRRHWWWRSREAILVREIERLRLPEPSRILDVGCGNGLFLEKLSRWGSVTGIEIDRTLVSEDAPFRDRIYHDPLGSRVYQGMQFDLITALDVIEHIEDDRGAVSHMLDLLAPGGHLVVTVPAFNLLWDEHDEINRHCRRYETADVRRLLEPFGRVLELRYLFPSLFAPKLLIAKLNRRRARKVAQTMIPRPFVTAVMTNWLRLEDRIASRIRPPVGTSVLAIMRQS